ncbi:hypothetical protein [Saccharopolyspora sp. 6M]|uniref:hypothetical protein n=1 Tax=Saccharopolyspora sp. 6M TaxID=2877237 RepID=UPI001CD206CC|nr:hypothetical protein [Saccharopolyspora sp. 6M]MCA1228649.1 hypothetical protein [Saccharopolyspora sp. 6M]
MSDVEQVHQFLSQSLHTSGNAALGLSDAEYLVSTVRAVLREATEGSVRDEVRQALTRYAAASDLITQAVTQVRAADEQVMAYQASL